MQIMKNILEALAYIHS